MTKSKLSLCMMILFSLFCWSASVGYAGELENNLFEAANGGNVADVRNLLEKGADVNLKDNSGETALMKASREGHLDAVKVLLADHLDCARILLEKGADVNARDKYDVTEINGVRII